MSRPLPDFDRLIADALVSRHPITLIQAHQLLGDFFEGHLIAQETLVFPRNGPIALTASSWVRVLRRAQAKARLAP